MTLAPAPAVCPTCHIALVAEYGRVPWCERCEHNLDHFTGRRFDRWAEAIGFDLNRRLFHEIAAEELKRPGMTSPLLVLLAISAVLMTVLVAVIGVAVYLVVAGAWPLKALGLILLAVAWLLRPRLGRLKPIRELYDEITRADAPALHAFLDRAAEAVGAKTPEHIFVGPQWNASAAVVGIRRRKVMMIGVPLWIAARPQERVFLIAHELAHFINRDVRRGLLTMPACTMFGSMADLVRPDDSAWNGWDDGTVIGGLTRLGQLISRPFMMALAHLLRTADIAIQVVAARQGQRAEYYADSVAAGLAGSRAASLFDLFHDELPPVIGSRARGGHGFDGWRTAVEEARAERAERMARLRQLTVREEASPFRHHPPTGLRHRMLALAPHQDPRIVLTDSEALLIDAELRRFERRYALVLAHDW
ncbi:hypothetical protein Rhe02_61930 [Rhizocola hellebori]|uniref:Peptidase M48 domain-containing protein n=1 Tax=Rhizocola hellebori TaxID=1392758 RepID=A0A8J3VJJ7_9ACTN|nr:M48 family metallopeptidase [Rhizocola hellebori]GIH08126.1 hypothetical protein Rhe02_61930 [Rhizocola hellebori]